MLGQFFASKISLCLISTVLSISIATSMESQKPEWFDEKEYEKFFVEKKTPYQHWLKKQHKKGVQDGLFMGREHVVVSLTSHPPRINTTWLTVESLLQQTYKPNKIILNLALEQFPDRKIPESLECLKLRGLDVYFSEINYKVATKLLPTLKNHPDSVIITADDDRIYRTDWLETLLKVHKDHPHMIVSPHVRRYIWEKSEESEGSNCLAGRINYLQQEVSITDYPQNKTSTPRLMHSYRDYQQVSTQLGSFIIMINGGLGLIFEGFAGVLYPPKAFDDQIFNFSLFQQFTPCADDVFYQVLAFKNNTKVIGFPYNLWKKFYWPAEISNAQETGLFHEHLNANDVMAYRFLYYFGLEQKLNFPSLRSMRCPSCLRAIPLLREGEKFPEPSRRKGIKCKSCLNDSLKKVLFVGDYDHGNLGNSSYKAIFDHYLGEHFETAFVPTMARMNRYKKYISLDSQEHDIDFDALVIGGGGILENFYKAPNAIRYYAEKALDQKIPLIFASVGLKTDRPRLNKKEAKEILGSETISLLEKSHLITLRTYGDYVLLQGIMNKKDVHKVLVYPDFGYLFPNIALSDIEQKGKKRFISLIQTAHFHLDIKGIPELIEKKLKQYKHTELAIIHMQGVDEPKIEYDFNNWNLFTKELIQKHFSKAEIIVSPDNIPKEHAKMRTIYVFKGDSISQQLKNDFYMNTDVRRSDLSSKKLLSILSQSDYIFTGDVHAYEFAHILGIPCESLSCSYEINVEKTNKTNARHAIQGMDILNRTLIQPRQLKSPMVWDDNKRNEMIVQGNILHPELSIPLLQSRDNESLFKLISYGLDY